MHGAYLDIETGDTQMTTYECHVTCRDGSRSPVQPPRMITISWQQKARSYDNLRELARAAYGPEATIRDVHESVARYARQPQLQLLIGRHPMNYRLTYELHASLLVSARQRAHDFARQAATDTQLNQDQVEYVSDCADDARRDAWAHLHAAKRAKLLAEFHADGFSVGRAS